jgi:hypothetical protein
VISYLLAFPPISYMNFSSPHNHMKQYWEILFSRRDITILKNKKKQYLKDKIDELATDRKKK